MEKLLPWAGVSLMDAIAAGTNARIKLGLNGCLTFTSIEVKGQLPKKYSPAKDLHKTQPLDISAEVKEKEASGYKVPLRQK